MIGHGRGIAMAAALACVAVTCLAACGSGAAPAFHPAGSALSSGHGQSAASVLHRFPFPADVHFQFDSPLPVDPAQAAVVITDENFQLAYYYGIYSQGKDHRYAAYIGDRMILASVRVTLARESAAHEGFTGAIRFYDTSVQPTAWPGEQAVTSCVDSSRLLDTDIRTGEIRSRSSSGARHFLQSDILAKRGGIWRVVGTSVTYYPHGQAKECKP